jgi:predicted solute-binding protein
MLAAADAALLIGDAALFAEHRALGAEKWDLGALWTEMTGLPFVWAFWSGPADATDAQTVGLLQEAARTGTARLTEVAREYAGGDPVRADVGARYLRDNLVFTLGPRAQQGLQLYFREATDLGFAPAVRELSFFAEP